MKTIKLYRYDGQTHYRGGCFPAYDTRCTDWSDNKQEQVDLYNSAKTEHFTAGAKDYTIPEMKHSNRFCTNKKEYLFFWCMLHEIEVPIKDWLEAKRTDNYEPLPYLMDYDYTELAQRGIYPNGKDMSEKVFDSIVYDGGKTETIKYGKL